MSGRPRPLQDWMEQEGLDLQATAQRVSEKLGKPVTPELVYQYSRRSSVPKSWAFALGIEGAADPPDSSAREGGAGRAASAERAPRMPPGAPVAPSLAVIGDVARERIAATYETVGYAAGLLLEEPGIKVVTDDYAPEIAKAWVKAAEENEFAARVVRLMSSGGAMGELVVCHLLWLMGIAYVTGRVDDPTGLLARKYKGQHDAAVARHAAAADVIPGRPAGAAGPGDPRRNGEGPPDGVGVAGAASPV